jgi:hypothetical protein
MLEWFRSELYVFLESQNYFADQLHPVDRILIEEEMSKVFQDLMNDTAKETYILIVKGDWLTYVPDMVRFKKKLLESLGRLKKVKLKKNQTLFITGRYMHYSLVRRLIQDEIFGQHEVVLDDYNEAKSKGIMLEKKSFDPISSNGDSDPKFLRDFIIDNEIY